MTKYTQIINLKEMWKKKNRPKSLQKTIRK